jgi:nucleoside-diphosphate-sugar epimerase
MKLLVTGASGFIGQNVLLRAPREWDVFAVYHQTPGLDAFVAGHGLSNVHPLKCNLLDAADVAALVARTGAVDACLYLAANGDPAESSERPAWDLGLNTLALVTLLERLEAEHVVYVSSGAVYDGLSGAVTPATPVAPRLPYAISKLASEHYVRAFCERRRSIDSYVNVRFFGAYGPYEPLRKITTKWLRAVVSGQRAFTLRGNGENLIDFMYVDDAVDGFLTLVKARGFRGTVDFASGAPVTVNDVVLTMARVLNADVRIVHEGRTEEYIEFHTVDPTMAEQFGFAPAIAFEDGIGRLRTFLAHESPRA